MVRSILSNWLAMAVTGAISVVLTPVLIHMLGDFHYGMWILVASLLEYSSFIDMGLRTTLQRFVARLRGAREREALNQTLATAVTLSLGVCVLLCVLTAIFAVVLPGFLGLAGSSKALFVRVVILLGLSVAVTFPGRVLAAYLCGLQRYDVNNLASIVTALIRAVLLVGALRLGYGVLGCSLVTLGVAVVSLVVHWRLVRWADPEASLNWWSTSWARGRDLFSFGIYVFLASMGDFLRSRIDSLVIARWLSMSLVTPFNVASRLIEYFRAVMFTIVGPLMTTMSALDGESRQKELQEVFLLSTKITALVSFFLGSLLLLNGKFLIRVWVGPAYLSAYAPLMVLLLGHVTSMAQSPSVNLLLASGRNRPLGWWTLSEGLVNLALSIYWAPKYGIVGVALGTALPQIFVKLTLQPWLALRVARLSAREYFLRALGRPLAVCGLFLSLTWLGTAIFPAGGLLQLFGRGAWETMFFGFLAYFIGLNATDRKFFWERGKLFASTLRFASAA